MCVPLSQLHKCGLDAVTTLPADHWKAILPKTVVWMDYLSMPQPGKEDCTSVGEKTGAQSDSRHLSTDLTKAVRSIPSYVELSEYFFVMAPPAQHKDMQEISDKATWASRGWCRMEAQAR